MKYILIFIPIYLISTFMNMYQNKNYFKALRRVKEKATLVSTGINKSYFKKGSVAIIGSNYQGLIICGELLKGRTVFADFKVIEDIEGLTLLEAKQKFEKESSIIQSIDFIEQKIKEENKG